MWCGSENSYQEEDQFNFTDSLHMDIGHAPYSLGQRQGLGHLRTRPSEPTLRISSVRRSSRRSVRSGYAFAHQEGFGRLIMSGKIMKKSKSSNFTNNLHATPKSNHWGKGSNGRDKGSPSKVEV